jgi:hypothetical protein
LPLPLPSPLPSPLPGPTPPPARATTPGTYTVWLWIFDTLTVNGSSFRVTANAVQDFQLGAAGPVRPRQVITTAACNACHVDIQAHGGSRAGDATVCSNCHTAGSVDRTVGSKGLSCTSDASCPGNAAGWEACDTVSKKCVVAVDPTPNQSIDFSVMVHNLHFARLREGYAERNNVNAGKLQYVGFNNGLNDFSDGLLPQDVRNCTKCHADTGAVCSASAPCGIGQECRSGKCVNRAWVQPSARVCLSCHDTADANGHAALNTWQSSSGPVETCGVCHGESGEFAVEKVHDVWSPFVPPYAREKAH